MKINLLQFTAVALSALLSCLLSSANAQTTAGVEIDQTCLYNGDVLDAKYVLFIMNVYQNGSWDYQYTEDNQRGLYQYVKKEACANWGALGRSGAGGCRIAGQTVPYVAEEHHMAYMLSTYNPFAINPSKTWSQSWKPSSGVSCTRTWTIGIKGASPSPSSTPARDDR